MLSLLGLLTAASALDHVVHTVEGPVEGQIEKHALVFLGIPFAAPPVGDLRFRQPQPVKHWNNTIKCFDHKPICPQMNRGNDKFLGNEDCLYLDVYVPPSATPASKLPVYFYAFGGAWVVGDSWEFGFYDGKNLVSKHNYIIVTPNYRLGALGFLALDQLRDEDADRTSGNYAVQDQRAALEWVQRNIGAFGGDPKKVTIIGESAGAFSVAFHLASEASSGLFIRAILESGTPDAPQFFPRWNEAKSFSEDYIRGLHCDPSAKDVLDCIRKLPVNKIIGHLMNRSAVGTGFRPVLDPVMPWGAAVDGSSKGLKGRPLEVIKTGKWNKVPIITGTNENEGSMFVSPALNPIVPNITYPLTDASLNITLMHFFGQNRTVVEILRKEYRTKDYKNIDTLTGHLLRDYFFACSARRLARAVSDQGLPAYVYHFTYEGDFIEDPIMGVYHGSELDFVFDNPWPPIVHEFSKKDRIMSDTFTSFWDNFVTNGNPNNGLAVKLPWPAYDDDAALNFIMNVPPSIEQHLLQERCSFWDKLVAEGNPWI